MRRVIGGVLVVSLLLAGCTDEYDDDVAATSTPPLVVQTAAPEDSAATSRSPEGSAAPSSAEPVDPDDSIGDAELLEAVEWVLELLEEDGEGPTVEEATERFAPEFLDEVSPVELGLVLAQVRSAGPYVVTAVVPSSGVGRAATLSLAAQDPLLMTVGVDEQGRIATLFLQPDTSGEPPVVDAWPDLDAALAELGGTSQVLVGRVQGGTCEPSYTTPGVEPGGDAVPSASVVKLLVLLAVAEEVRSGGLTWDEELTLTADVVSLPSGELQDRPEGSMVPVREAAELMISISDNTATDLLMDRVGRRALREAAVAAGLDPTATLPVPTSRQVFQLGWQVDSEVRTRWAEAQVPETREAILADLPDELDIAPETVTEPRWQDGIDWFLTGAQVCSLHARLQQLAEDPAGEPVREILARNPGLPPPEGVGYQAFKGGSLPGVLAMSFYVEPRDDAGEDQDPGAPEGLVLVVQTRSAEPVDPLRAATVVGAGLQHLVDVGG
ncbi:serine hydrolase [uncultured Serinicoccus sp.]|uniref:serine hydrolase n=1 Tax=uncultured Serinicoccus sp. TaxID=735514 RepID=UPI0026271978|nr:serine hydrolase [uncultured Serinicoccus sp.]